MTIENIDRDATLKKVEKLLSEEKGLSPAMRSMVDRLSENAAFRFSSFSQKK